MQLIFKNGRFKLLEKLRQASPEKREGALELHSAANRKGIDAGRLAFFALSVLWRAAVYDWRLLGSKVTSVSLGPYQDVLRKYLVGGSPFPSGVVVVATACTDTWSEELFYEPTAVVTREHETFRRYAFLARGIHFEMLLGAAIPACFKRLCCFSSRERWIIVADRANETVDAFKNLHATSRVARGLADSQ